ncbi:MAG: response regulator [Planctomycetia bacterium]|nr:response regulator [Planctomycetia bacterium]
MDDTSSKNSFTGRTILVVDDHEDMRGLFKLMLGRLGYKVVSADNGKDAVNLYEQALHTDAPVAAVILDLNLPGGMGGNEVAEKLHAMDPCTRIIVCSGDTEGPEMTRFKDFGYSGALEKIFNKDKVKQVLEQVLSQNP